MAGIYVHIPFCKKACHYCNFHFSTSLQTREEMAEAMLKEIALQSAYLSGETIDTIYFGGGTPSALPPDDILRLMDHIHQYFSISHSPEVTLEANPDDIDVNHLHAWTSAGINRLSIGVQAFQDELLQAWNRSHDARQARNCINLAQDAGFTNLTADLIYGDPGLSDKAWEENINILLESQIPHISSYALTVEEKTALEYQIRKGRRKPMDEEQAGRQYAMLQGILAGAGFEQYEVSNFAKPGYSSKHNQQYWSGAHYLGIGPSAHSYNGMSRQWNIAHNVRYIQSLQSGNIPFEMEILTAHDIFNETVMTGMRTSAGIDTHRIALLGEPYLNYLLEQVTPLITEGKMVTSNEGRYRLRPEYFFFADGLAADVFLTSDIQVL